MYTECIVFKITILCVVIYGGSKMERDLNLEKNIKIMILKLLGYSLLTDQDVDVIVN